VRPGRDGSHGLTRHCVRRGEAISDILSYKGYRARVEFDADDRIFFGRVAGIEDGVGFHADAVDGLITAFHEAVDDYLETAQRLASSRINPIRAN
jgi:predicted HicB family RNase H-like nuclease